MECYVHPDQAAVGACVACGNFVCDVCRVSIKSRIYCKACVERGDAVPPSQPAEDRSHRRNRPPSGSGPLTRSRTDRMIAGVCGGLARQFDLDVNVVRLLFALISIFTGFFPGVVVYIVLWAVLPEGD